jgi:hypothetical protein
MWLKSSLNLVADCSWWSFSPAIIISVEVKHVGSPQCRIQRYRCHNSMIKYCRLGDPVWGSARLRRPQTPLLPLGFTVKDRSHWNSPTIPRCKADRHLTSADYVNVSFCSGEEFMLTLAEPNCKATAADISFCNVPHTDFSIVLLFRAIFVICAPLIISSRI